MSHCTVWVSEFFYLRFIRKKITSRGKDNKITRMETVTDHGDPDERIERGGTLAEEEIYLLQSETESDASDLG